MMRLGERDNVGLGWKILSLWSHLIKFLLLESLSPCVQEHLSQHRRGLNYVEGFSNLP